jgi:hypothetical protein
MRARVLFGLSLALALAAPSLPASAFRSCGDQHSVGQAPYLCADATARSFAQGQEGSNATTAGVAFFNQAGGTADNISTGAGGLAGVARVDVDWGTVRAYASADNGTWTTPDFINAESRSYGDAQGAFADIGTLVSPTLPVGTPVAITVTMDVDGGFSPDGGGGQAELTLSKVSNFVAFYQQRDAILFDGGGFVPPPFALENYFVGDQLIFKLEMVAAAGTTNRVSPVVSTAVADMENTGRLVIEIGTPGVTLESVSGHDYTTAPEPGRGLLLASAALLVAARAPSGWRRRAPRQPSRGARAA